jgi:GDPmannose 4,6-dehydratase
VKTVLVIGSAGQDGQLLCERLQREGHLTVGVERARTVEHRAGASKAGAKVDLRMLEQVRALVAEVRPDEIYYLAAHHHSAEDLDQNFPALLQQSHEVHVHGLVNVLEAVRSSSPRSRVFYAASSHVFGYPESELQSEVTPLEPRCAYGITKTTGIHTCRFYRDRQGLHVSIGILYNHESPYRARRFVSQRIANGAREALAARRDGKPYILALGNLSAVADWGYAPDYVDAMLRIVGRDQADDFVVATGVRHTVQDFAAAAFASVGLDWREHIEEKAGIVRKDERTLIGDSTKLRRATGWAPTVDFDEMVRRLVKSA